MSKKILACCLAVVLLFTCSFSATPSFASPPTNLEYWELYDVWTTIYGTSCYLYESEYQTSGNSISSSQISSLSAEEKVARTILGEICNLSDREDNAYAVAQTIKNRMNHTNQSAVNVVSNGAYAAYGQSAFRNPLSSTYLGGDYMLWAHCMWLAACLVDGGEIPTYYFTNIGNRRFCYDVLHSGTSKFYYDLNIQNGTKSINDINNYYTTKPSTAITCNLSNITTAVYYYAWSRYNKITGSPIYIGGHIYYEAYDN